MRAGAFFKHEDCTDAFIECLKIQYRDAKRVKCRVSWWCQGATCRFPFGVTEAIEIPRQDLPKWKEQTKLTA